MEMLQEYWAMTVIFIGIFCLCTKRIWNLYIKFNIQVIL